MVERYFTLLDLAIAIALATLLSFPLQIAHYFYIELTTPTPEGMPPFGCRVMWDGYLLCEYSSALLGLFFRLIIFNLMTTGIHLMPYYFGVFLASLLLVQPRHFFINRKYKLYKNCF